MNYEVIVSESAKVDIRTNARWYNTQKRGLGKEFTWSIKECIRILQSQPRTYQVRYKKIRFAIPDKFPYLILYDLNNQNRTIRIIGVIHSSQNPESYLIRSV
ncbi:MAG: type II toxin-antitoxin system RelE/ParE family toxin [Bacteroidales bacterium]|nr:type II toxin-antitoxin system RelE/ParE family toxin [Bacteroidales bacterium]MCF8454635.1 type II toxin-antitoxin system RelE/ParE family toxin [Bacteroidales bacterium]